MIPILRFLVPCVDEEVRVDIKPHAVIRNSMKSVMLGELGRQRTDPTRAEPICIHAAERSSLAPVEINRSIVANFESAGMIRLVVVEAE